MQRALMNIELAVSKLAFQKNGMLKKFVGMQAHHVANGNAGLCQTRNLRLCGCKDRHIWTASVAISICHTTWKVLSVRYAVA